MKALVYLGPEQMAYQDVEPAKAAGADELLVSIKHSGICGSDMHAYLGHDERRPAPLILGHEASGVVQTEGPWAGKKVAINPLVACGTCDYCTSERENLCPTRQIISMPPREGAFAEAVYMPPGNLVEVPEGAPLWQAALTEPMACGWHTVKLSLAQARPRSSQLVAVVLGGGAIGVGAALSLACQSPQATIAVVEPNDLRRRRLEKDLPQFRWAASDQELGDLRPDVVIDAVGYSATRAAASAMVNPGGVIGHIGLGQAEGGLDVRRMTLQEITFIGTYTYTPADFRETAKAIFDGQFGDMAWVDPMGLSDGVQAFKDLRAGKIAGAKVLLNV